MYQIHLKPKEERRLLHGHLWAYRNELDSPPATEDGRLVDLLSSTGRFVGRGFFQSEGGIAVRLLSRTPITVDASFFTERIDDARRFREDLFPGESVYRWVFGESDGLPGLTADRYGPVVVAQTSCSFYEKWADILSQAFLAHRGVEAVRLNVAGQILRSGDMPATVQVVIGGLRFEVDAESGQKTGLFLDQRTNILKMRRFAAGTDAAGTDGDTASAGARVLDGHCYVGLWSCHAAHAGAREVLGIDTSSAAISRAQHHARLNNVDDRCTFECGDIAEVLARGERYDLIMLDPPALAKSRAHQEKALSVYQALNRDAMRSLNPGGYLITSSCSHFVDSPTFLEALKRASRAVQRDVLILDIAGASPDHPVLIAMPETSYLKCVTLRIL